MKAHHRTNLIVICSILGVAIALIGGGVYIAQRGQVLQKEHRARKSALFDANMAMTKLQIRRLKWENEFRDAGASAIQAENMVMTPQFRENLETARAKQAQAQAALDAFYLAHPTYRDKP